MWRDALLVAGKDLRIELRSRVALWQVLPFALLTLVLFAFALGPGPAALRRASPGLFWLAVLFSTVLAVQRSFAIEAADNARDGLRLSGLDPGGIFLGKAGAIAALLVALEVLLGIVVVLLYGVRVSDVLELIAAAIGATVGLAAVGTLYGVLAAGTRVAETLLPLLFLPVVVPVLIAATKVWQEILKGTPLHALGWLALLWVFAIAYSAIGTVAFGPLLEGR